MPLAARATFFAEYTALAEHIHRLAKTIAAIDWGWELEGSIAAGVKCSRPALRLASSGCSAVGLDASVWLKCGLPSRRYTN